MKVEGEYRHSAEFTAFIRRLGSPAVQQAAAMGINEHAAEQRRGSVSRITSYTGVPRGRVAGSITVVKASPGPNMQAIVRGREKAIMLAEYGNPVWVRDLSPMADGKRGGPVSSMKGAEATAWNVRRQFKHAFIANGQVVVRTSKERYPLKVLSAAVLPNELSKPSRPNVPAAERYAAFDLERRVMRHVVRVIGS